MVKIVKANSAEELENKVNEGLKHFKKIKVVGYGIAIKQSGDNYRNNTKWYRNEYSCMLIGEDEYSLLIKEDE